MPGYYHRLGATGAVLRDSCCDDTATENAMMAKLMTDSVVTWARDYHVSSFRFDIMGLQPRDAMVALQAKVDAAVGHHVELLGEGWNFGAVANGARFVQADMLDLNGTGIGTFNPVIRDAIRGGGCCDSRQRADRQPGLRQRPVLRPERAGRRPQRRRPDVARRRDQGLRSRARSAATR